ncbi:GntP family permease [Youngiibacter fragilis]|uniref:Gluconate permease n=1 Tax=Youngiibacter fragilis 232.1 TaxID=994573 RepID=V7I5X9_9CLOT|nr:gluconate:H+ symporter [Youngiibacter fragilis]ETA80706.1 gluconate permease [Youngiibacter fragilis 232.1]
MITGSMLLVIFVVAIAALLLSIIKFKANPFLALMGVSILTGLMVRMPLPDIASNISKGFGNTMGGVGIVIGLGIILGQVLAESRAINAIANGMLKTVGSARANLAINISGWLISIPVFQDAAFVIFMPLVRQIQKSTKKPLVALVTALGVGTIASHSMIIPTPGPVAVAGNMGVNIGSFLFYSLIVSLPATLIGGVLYSKFLEKRADKNAYLPKADHEVAVDNRPMPTMKLSLSVLLFPLLLILVGSIAAMILPKENAIRPIFAFFGDKNIALFIGVIVAFLALGKYFDKSTETVIKEATISAGLIFLITGAGGSFGTVINTSGIGQYLVDTLTNMNVSIIVLGFILSQLLRAAQGSTTVALVTTSSILGPLVAGTAASPVLVALAICAGGIGVSLPNDSGFWVLSNYSGLSVQDTIKAWTVGGTIVGASAFMIIMALSAMPFLPGL